MTKRRAAEGSDRCGCADTTNVQGPMSEGMGMMAKCHAMMTSFSKSAETGASATPDTRALFEEWARRVETEILTALKEHGQADLDQLAARVKLSPESVTQFLTRLVHERKVSISAIQPAPGQPSNEA